MKDIKLAVTMGDPAGIGPEILCKTLLDKEFCLRYHLEVVGSKNVLEYTFKNVLKVQNIPDFIIHDVGSVDINHYKSGVIDPEYGRSAIKYIARAYNLVKKNMLSAIVTCPINKKSIKLAGLKYPGHTEYLGFLAKKRDFSMMLAGDKIKVVLVTTHIPLRDVFKSITIENIFETIKNAHNAGKFFGHKRSRIAVAGLNPHAGDSGAIADEEIFIIEPAVKMSLDKGFDVTGPMPADTLFPKMLSGEYDIAVVMYHDQGLIPVKMESFGSAVNITLNLPFVRTSVDHGTAFDIAGKGIANENSLKKAIEVAFKMVKNAQSA